MMRRSGLRGRWTREGSARDVWPITAQMIVHGGQVRFQQTPKGLKAWFNCLRIEVGTEFVSFHPPDTPLERILKVVTQD
jgi:hypothetical protein